MNIIPIWRTKPKKKLLKNHPFRLTDVFPNGRQTISHSLFLLGLGRKDRVAFPEWSSHCVVSAIGKYCTPIPMREAVKHKIKVSAILIYEQWGWPITVETINKIRRMFGDVVLIWDMVDSTDYFKRLILTKTGFSHLIRIISLSKLLGLAGGGLLHYNGQFIKNENYPLIKEIKNWIKNNDLYGAIEEERISRQNNLRMIIEHPISKNWPTWMKNAVKNGSGPNIAPLFRGKTEKEMRDKQYLLKKKYCIETAIYHFDWNGNPLTSHYEKCLAFPVHGQVRGLEHVLSGII